MKTRNGRIGCILKKYDVFNMLPPKDDWFGLDLGWT
jgi:hypothetical protein